MSGDLSVFKGPDFRSAVCGICETKATGRRLDRDHWHTGPRAGEPRRAWPDWPPDWLLASLEDAFGGMS